MKHQTDTKFRTERLQEWEVHRLSEKYGAFSFSEKSTWVSVGIIMLVLLVIALIMPFFPPRYGWGNWSPPKTLDDYQSRVSGFLIVIPLILLIGLAYAIIRNYIDLKAGVKRTANFIVTDVIDLGIYKILVLNGWRLFGLRYQDSQFHTVIEGQTIIINRTVTYRLISYSILNKEDFVEDQYTKKASH